jgi:hypothetical protein
VVAVAVVPAGLAALPGQLVRHLPRQDGGRLVRLVYVVGVPGAGKTTLVRATIQAAGLGRWLVRVPFAHEVLHRHTGTIVGAHLGRDRQRFGGTDTLSMSVAPLALRWLAGRPYPMVVGEGDRLASAMWFAAVQAEGVNLALVHLDTPAALAEVRRAARGSRQSRAWVAGRVTKTHRLAGQAALRLDGTAPLAENAAALAGLAGWPLTAEVPA